MTIEQFNKAKSCFSRKEKIEDILKTWNENKLKSGWLYFKANSYIDHQVNLQCPPNLQKSIFDLLIGYYTNIKNEIDAEIENI